MMKTAADISSKIPTALTDSSRKAELTPSPIKGKGSDEQKMRRLPPIRECCVAFACKSELHFNKDVVVNLSGL